MFDYPNVEAIAGYLIQELAKELTPGVEPVPPSAGTEARLPTLAARTPVESDRAAEIESLSDDEVEALLLQKLESMEST
jgi:hypothetical protein